MKKFAALHPYATIFVFLIASIFAGVQIVKSIDCKTAYTTVDLIECSGRDYKAADKELNDVYKKLSAIVEKKGGKKAKTKLVESQRTWIAFRDKECEFSTVLSADGSMYPLEMNGCLTTMTQKRTSELKEHLSVYSY